MLRDFPKIPKGRLRCPFISDISIICGLECHTMRKNFIFGFAIYFSYLILFGKFFFKAYLSYKWKNKVRENVHVNGRKECYKLKTS